MYGVAGAYLSLYHFERWKARATLLCFIGLTLVLLDKLMSNSITYLNYFNITVISLGTLLMLPYLSNWRRPHDLVSRIVTFVSVISYSMYLVNLSLIQKILYPFYKSSCPDCATSSISLYLAYWVTTIACSSILYYFFERHMTKLRDRITVKRKAVNVDYSAISSSESFSAVHAPKDSAPVNK
jgi:peptidoglycan/LPS O-acetylase OafA/YrhL